MHMRMKDQIARPGVQHAHQTDLTANIAWIKGKFLSRISRSLKEQGI